ncbi:MAG: citrate (Si)-synthase [Waddliaceae bacterium]
MMNDVIFEIKVDNLETGLRGYPCGYCSTSSVDPEKGLFYSGHPVTEMEDWPTEKVIYLLYFAKEPSEDELVTFTKKIRSEAQLKQETVDAIRRLPREGHPMKLFSAALLIAGMSEGKEDYKKDAYHLLATLPQIAATVINHHAGWGEVNESNPELGYIENFVHMLNLPDPHDESLIDTMRLFHLLHMDHGGGNLSAFVGKAVASGLEDIYGSLSSAMCALAGPRHGKANQDCLSFVQEIVDTLGEDVEEAKLEQYIRDRLESKKLVYGFGHAVLRVEDPRATTFYELSAKKYSDHPLVKIAHLLHTVGPKVLKENPKIQNPYPNVDAISGITLYAAGFPYPQYYTVLFGLSRCIGISRQIIYERLEAREGKGTPIVRPKYLYRAP